MFDVGFWELFLIAVLGLVVLGPERLPRVARAVGLWAGRARGYVRQLSQELDRELQSTELKQSLQELQKPLDELNQDLGKLHRDARLTPPDDDDSDAPDKADKL